MIKNLTIKSFFLISIFALISLKGYSQTSYDINVHNDVVVNPSQLKFDIYLLNTGTDTIEYAVGQYIISYDEAIKNGGDLTLSMVPGSSELHSYLVPDSTKLKVNGNQIQIFGMPPFGSDSAFIIPTGDSIRIGSFLLTNSTTYSPIPWGFEWKNQGTFRTKIFAYITDVNTNITDTSRHIMVIENNTSSIIQLAEVPVSYSLGQNYPNPFNPVTKIKFSVPERTLAVLTVFDMLGRQVASLLNDEIKAGVYEYSFDGSALSSGIYYYRISTESFSETKKMVLIK